MNWLCRIGYGILCAQILLLNATSQPAQAQTAVESGRAWLITQVQSDGSIAGEQHGLATAIQTRAEVLDTLRRLGVDVNPIGQALQLQPDESVVEHLARRLFVEGLGSNVDPQRLAALRAAQHADGGFGGSAQHQSNVLDTSFALIALRATGELRSEAVGRALGYLAAHISDLDQPGWALDARSQPYVAAYLLLAMQSFAADYPLAASIDQARAHLLALQGGGVYAETLLNAVGAIALAFSSTGSPALDALRADLMGSQDADGSWLQDAYLTALALRALIDVASPPPPVGGRLVATIRDAATLQPLAGARWVAVGVVTHEGYAGSDGRALLEDLPPGSYQPAVSHPGYISPPLPAVDLIVGQTIDFGFVNLIREADTAVLRGRVTNVADGQPIAGAEIAVSGVYSATVYTDPAGRYEIVGDRAGAIEIRVARSGFREVLATTQWVLGQVVEFSPALYPLGYEPPAHAILVGQVVRADGDQPLADAMITVGGLSAASGAEGRFLLQPLPLGDFEAVVSHVGYLDTQLSGALAAGVNDAGIIRLQAANGGGLSQLSGQVSDSANATPLVGALVEIIETGQRTQSDTQGAFRIDDVATVPFTVRASSGGYQSREVQFNAGGHGSFVADLRLDRLTGADVVLDGLTMSAPEAEPYVEVGVLGTVRNTGSADAGLVFSAIVRDAAGAFVREVPAIMTTLASVPGDDVQTIAAGATLAVTIAWGLPGDLPGDYGVEFRGMSPSGQLLVQGHTGYRVLAVRRLGGGVILDPPLLTAGLNQSVKLDARLANHGNLPIAAGEVELTVTLSVPDNRPPVPPEPQIGPDLATGAPLARPVRAAYGADGQFYTINWTARELVRVSPDGQMAVMRVLDGQFNGAGTPSMGQPNRLLMAPDARLRLAWTSGYVSTIDTTEPYAQSNVPAPVTMLSAYLMGTDGQEYFAGRHDGHNRLVRRGLDGNVSVLAESGFGSPAALTHGPDGALYVSNELQGTVHRVDPDSGAITLRADGLNKPTGILFDASGGLLVAERTQNRVVRWENGLIEPVMTDIPDPRELRLGQDGRVYGLSFLGQIYRGTADGSSAELFASGSVTTANSVRFDDTGNALLLASNELRRRNLDGSIETIATGLQSAADVLALPDQSLLILEPAGIKRLSGGQLLQLLTAAGSQFKELTRDADGSVFVAGSIGSDAAIWRLENETLQLVQLVPTLINDLLQLGNRSLLVSPQRVFELTPDGRITVFGPSFGSIKAATIGGDGALYVYDSLASSVGVYRVLVSGASERIAGGLPGHLRALAVDAGGEIIYQHSDRTLVRYNPQLQVSEPLVDSPLNTLISSVTLDEHGIPYVQIGAQIFLVQNRTTQLFSSSGTLLNAHDGRLWWRSISQVLTRDGSGNTINVGPVAPGSNLLAVRSDGMLDWFTTARRFQFRDSDFDVREMVELPRTPLSIAAANGAIWLTDVQYRLTRLQAGHLLRVGGDLPNFQRVRSDASGRIVVSAVNGLFEVSADVPAVPVWTAQGWNNGEYRSFDIRDSSWLAANSSTNEVRIDVAGEPLVQLAPFRNGTSFVQQENGRWLVGGSNVQVEIDVDGLQSRVVGRIRSLTALDRSADGLIYGLRGQDRSLLVYDGDLQPSVVAQPDAVPVGAGMRLSAAGGAIFVVTNSGEVLRRDGDFLRLFSGGIVHLVDLAVNSRGQVYTLDSNMQGVGLLDEQGYRLITNSLGTVYSMVMMSDDRLAVSGATAIYSLIGDGRWSRRTWTGIGQSHLARVDQRRVLVADFNGHRVFEVDLGEPMAQVAAGTVVHRVQRPHQSFGVEGIQSIDFGEWAPHVSGQYDVVVKSLDSIVEGRAASGLYVGPAAQAVFDAVPARTAPGVQDIAAHIQLRGADFRSLSRVDTSLLELIVPDSVYPEAMGADASGAVWYRVSNRLRRAPLGAATGEFVTSDLMHAFIGEIPIDRLQRAYVVTRPSGSPARYQLRRYDLAGQAEVLVEMLDPIQSITIDASDQIYLLVGEDIHRWREGSGLEHYVDLPSGSPYGITRDGFGNLYVQQHSNRVLRIDSARQVSSVLSDANFEYEGFNIAGTCGEGLYFTPITYPRVGQNGEEYTIAQLSGVSGEIGPVFNGRVVSHNIIDIDFIVYDRFASQLLLFTHIFADNRQGMFRMPVHCGALDMDLHVLLPPGQPHSAFDPPFSQRIEHADGSIELIWTLADVTQSGETVRFMTALSELQRGEQRPLALDSWIEFRNSFLPEPQRMPVQVPLVQVEDLVRIDVRTDRDSYHQQEPVAIEVTLNNDDAVNRQGQLQVLVVDDAGVEVVRLIDRPEVFPALEIYTLQPPFNTGSHRSGDYGVVARVLNAQGVIEAEARADFVILPGNGAGVVASSVATDQPRYPTSADVRIFARVRNLSANQGLASLTVTEQVYAPDGSLIWSDEQLLPNLEPDTERVLEFGLHLDAVPDGLYSVQQRVFDESGEQLSEASVSFLVEPEEGVDALSGNLQAQPAQLRVGESTLLSAEVHNRSSAGITAMPLSLRVLDPANGMAVIAQWPFQYDFAAGQTRQLSVNWQASGVAVGPYVAVLMASPADQVQALDQVSLHVGDVVLNGTLQVDPPQAQRDQAVAIAATVSNAGNLPAIELPLELRVVRQDAGTVVQSWQRSVDLPPGAELSWNEVLAPGSLPAGQYRIILRARLDGQDLQLAQADLEVLAVQLGGLVEVVPVQAEVTQPVQISATVSNSGNSTATALPIRLEVRRLDTQSLQQEWSETIDLAGAASHTLQREWIGSTAAPYEAILLAQVDGSWQRLSAASFSLTAPAVDVDMRMFLQRDARLLVLVSCEPGATGESVGSNPGAGACAAQRQLFLQQYLSQLGIDHKVVLTADDFMNELRCGRYNSYWLSGGSEKLPEADADELRETIYRGDGLLIDGSHDQRTSHLDEIAGYRYRGHLPDPDQWLRGTGSLFPEVDVATYGRALRLESATGVVLASFLDGTPSIISNGYGQGRALIWAFDLVNVLQRDAVLPASAALFDLALLHVAPTTLAADHAAGSRVPVTTEVENRAATVDLQLRSSASAPLVVVDAAPTPTTVDSGSATWDFTLGAGQQRSFDLTVQSTLAPAQAEIVSALAQRDGALLRPLSNLSLPLLIRDPQAAAEEVIIDLQGAQLRGGEAAARNRAVDKLIAARTALATGNAGAAIAACIDAADEVVRIDSVPHDQWRLGISRLLEVAQRARCERQPSAGLCDVLGIAKDFNGFFLGDYSATSSDVQGALAAGGHINLIHYSIGDQLPADYSGASLLAGADIVFPSGRVYFGDIVAGGSVTGVGAPVANGLSPHQQLFGNTALPFDFSGEFNRLRQASQHLAGLTANGTWTSQWGGLYLRGDGQSPLQVFELPGDLVLQAHTFDVQDVPDGASVLFNVAGSQSGLTNMSLQSLVPHRERVLFNFPQATQLILQGIAVEGSVLAPNAQINQPQGVLWGNVVAVSWDGMMQLNHVVPMGCYEGGQP